MDGQRMDDDAGTDDGTDGQRTDDDDGRIYTFSSYKEIYIYICVFTYLFVYVAYLSLIHISTYI